MTITFAVKVELRPTKAQAEHLARLAEDSRLLWNELLVRNKIEHHRARDEGRKQDVWWSGGSLRKSRPPLGQRWASAIDRPVDEALRRAWRAVKEGRCDPPRHKHVDAPASFAFQVQGNGRLAGGLKVPLLPERIDYKEDPLGRVTGIVVSATVSRDVDRWYVALCVIDAPEREVAPHDELIVGIDLNTVVIACSDGRRFEIPAELERLDARLREAQHDLARYRSRRRRARAPKRSARYDAARLELGRLYRRVRRVRDNWIHHVTTEMTRTCTVLVLEDLRVKNMTRSAAGTIDNPGSNVSAKSGLNRAILNAAFGEIRRQCEYKGAWYGCEIVVVNPAYTSRTCSVCEHVNEMPLATYRTFVCEACGHTQDRDDNAAANIRIRGEALRSTARSGEGVERDQGLPSATKRQRQSVPRAQARKSARKTGDPPRVEDRAEDDGANVTQEYAHAPVE